MFKGRGGDCEGWGIFVMDSGTIRVLSLDGGGMRGVITARFLELFCVEAGINPGELWKYFDIIAGTSIGGIQALGYGMGLTPTFVKNLLIENGSRIFNSYGMGQAGYVAWTGYLSGLRDSLYSADPLRDLIEKTLGIGTTLRDMKTRVLIPSFKRVSGDGSIVNYPVYFSNISKDMFPFLDGGDELAVNVALATSAAPVYFPAATFNGVDRYVDGGIFMNNPSSLALSIMRGIRPTASRYCILSVGTGLGSIGYIPGENLRGISDNLGTIKMVMDVAMAIPPEGVSKELEILGNQTIENCFYYRMQYQIPVDQNPDSSLDNSSDAFISYMQSSATDYFNNDLSNITTFIGHLFA